MGCSNVITGCWIPVDLIEKRKKLIEKPKKGKNQSLWVCIVLFDYLTTVQYLYKSEKMGIRLDRRIFLPPREKLSS